MWKHLNSKFVDLKEKEKEKRKTKPNNTFL